MPHAWHGVQRGMLLLLAAAAGVAFALTPSHVFDKVKGSIVVVKALDAQGKPVSQGTGVMLPSGKIVPNCHVLETGARYQVGKAKQLIPAYAVGSPQKLELASQGGYKKRQARAVPVGLAGPSRGIGAETGSAGLDALVGEPRSGKRAKK